MNAKVISDLRDAMHRRLEWDDDPDVDLVISWLTDLVDGLLAEAEA